MRTDRKKGLSSGERKLLANARQILISEMMLAADITQIEAEKVIQEAVELG